MAIIFLEMKFDLILSLNLSYINFLASEVFTAVK